MKIIVVGSGKLANAIRTSGLFTQPYETVKRETQGLSVNEKTIVVHAGSGRQLNECFEFCSKTKSVLIELSTGLKTEKAIPDFPLIICPNISILILKTLNMLKANGRYFEHYDISITESHQSAKNTEPGTAYAFARSLNFSTDKIVSVRCPDIQQNKIGIPAEYLDKHAWHKIVIKDGDDEVTIETKVLGHASYAKGVKAIVDAIMQNKLENKCYSVFELIDKNIL